jgi:cytoskeletal protein RodZ
MKRFLVGLSKVTLGILLSFVIMSLAGVAVARYFITRLAELPERPTFDNDVAGAKPAAPGAANAQEPPAKTQPEKANTDKSQADQTDAAKSEKTDAQKTEAEKTETVELPAGSYQATVVQPIGLIVRSGPGTDFQDIGGVEYEDNLVVLEETQGWVKVRTSSGQEGWVKSGNTQRVQ